MPCSDQQTFLKERIEATKSAIIEAENAEVDIMAGTAASYTIDTGQTRQTVTKHNISSLKSHIDSLYNRYTTLCARLTGGGTHTARPDW